MPCQICGEYSGYYPLCPECFKLKDGGKAFKCEKCGKWFKGNEGSCTNCLPLTVKSPSSESICEKCGKPSKGKPLCHRCWSIQEYNLDDSQKENKPTTIEQSIFGKTRIIQIYEEVLRKAWEDGIITDEEGQILASLRQHFNITMEEHDQIESPIKRDVQSAIRTMKEIEETKNELENSFRKKFPPRYRTKDGHVVRSRAERTIDDWFYENGIVHCYERKLKGVNVYCDFFIPGDNGGTYVEFWGMPEREDYKQRMHQKKEKYEELKLNLINVIDEHIDDPEINLEKLFGFLL